MTDSRSKCPIDDEAYKIILYDNKHQQYRFGLAFAGLAAIRGKKTADWLCEVIHLIMNRATPIDTAIPRFAEACTRELGLLRYPLIFVMAGRFNNIPNEPQRGRLIPFLAIVSNVVGEHGRQLGTPTRAFHAYSCSLPRRNQSITIWRGNLKHIHHPPGDARNRLARYMRRDISADAKVELCAKYVQDVAVRSKNAGECIVGKHILGLALMKDECCTGYDLPPEGRRPQRTMPHAVSSSGWSIANFKVTEYYGE